MTRISKKSRKTQKPSSDILQEPLKKLDELNKELRATGYEVVLRSIPTKDVVAFDFGLVFTKDSKEVGLYVDDVLRDILVALAVKHGQVLLKANWFSPDVIVVTPSENPDPLKNTPDTETASSLDAPQGT